MVQDYQPQSFSSMDTTGTSNEGKRIHGLVEHALSYQYNQEKRKTIYMVFNVVISSHKNVEVKLQNYHF